MPRQVYAKITVLLVLVIVLYYVLRILEPFLTALAWAAILATIFHPLFSLLGRRLRRPQLASALSCLLVTVGIVLPAVFLLFVLAKQSVGAYRTLEVHAVPGGAGFLDAIRKSSSYQWFLAKTHKVGLPEPDLAAVARRAIGIVSEFLVNRSASLFSSITHFVLTFIVMILSLYYLLLHGIGILHELRQLSPLRSEYEDRIIEKFRHFTRAVFGGLLVTSLLHGVAGGLIFLFFGLPSPVLWAAVMALLSLVPVVGASLVWGPLVIYYLLTGAVWKGITLFVIFGSVLGVVDNVVKPLLLKRGTEIDALWILLSVIGGIGLFGFLGFFLGPFLITLLLALLEIYKAEFQAELKGDSVSNSPPI